jgi:hypothetical protein
MNSFYENMVDSYELISNSADFQMNNIYTLRYTNSTRNIENMFMNLLSNDNIIITIQHIDLLQNQNSQTPIKKNVFDEFKENTFEQVKNDQHTYSELIDKCIICMDNYENEDLLKILPCHHYYHKECIKEWLLNYNHICPICKKDCN